MNGHTYHVQICVEKIEHKWYNVVLVSTTLVFVRGHILPFIERLLSQEPQEAGWVYEPAFCLSNWVDDWILPKMVNEIRRRPWSPHAISDSPRSFNYITFHCGRTSQFIIGDRRRLVSQIGNNKDLDSGLILEIYSCRIERDAEERYVGF